MDLLDTEKKLDINIKDFKGTYPIDYPLFNLSLFPSPVSLPSSQGGGFVFYVFLD